MDTATMIVGAVLVAVCVLPIAYIIIQSKANQRKQLNSFQILARYHQLDISESDTWKNKFIGIDKAKNCVLFIWQEGEDNKSELIKLRDYHSCRPLEVFREQVAERMGLELTTLSNSPKHILFYDLASDTEADVHSLRTLVQKWTKLVQGRINRAVVVK